MTSRKGMPNCKDYHTDDGMHAAMRQWAKTKQRSTLSVAVAYSDGSTYETTFERASEQVFYRTRDGEQYGQDVDSTRFINEFMDGEHEMGSAQIKRAFEAWAGTCLMPGVTILKTTWKFNQQNIL